MTAAFQQIFHARPEFGGTVLGSSITDMEFNMPSFISVHKPPQIQAHTPTNAAHSIAPQNRLLPQLGAPMSPGEVRRIERWLATARLTLAISALFAIWMDPSQISWWAHWLLGIYIIHGTVVMLLLRFRKHSTPAFRSLVHAADLVWPALISVFAIGARHPFFLFFVFVLAAAAYRWGLWETVGTAAASVMLLWLESVAVHQGFLASVEDFLLRHHWPELGIDVVELEPKHLFMHSVYLLVMGWLLGYLAEQQKLLRAEVERARFADALHDGALQSMYAAAMHLEALRSQSASQVVTVAQEPAPNPRLPAGGSTEAPRTDAADETAGRRCQESARSPYGACREIPERKRHCRPLCLRVPCGIYEAEGLRRTWPVLFRKGWECAETQRRTQCPGPVRSQGWPCATHHRGRWSRLPVLGALLPSGTGSGGEGPNGNQGVRPFN